VDGVGPDGELLVRVRAAPAEGAANDAVTRVIAEALDVSRSSVTIVRGVSARRKQVAVEGADAPALSRRWPGLVLTTRQ
jgi:uncharacterized protein YggU (UPF0235/DUF167 family)